MRRFWCWLAGEHEDRLVMVAHGVGDWHPVTLCVRCRREVRWW